MTSSIEEFEIPYGGDVTGEGCCESRTKGFVLHVDKCLNHENWIHLHSSNTAEYESDGATTIKTGGDLTTLVSGGSIETVAASQATTIGGSQSVQTAGSVSVSIGGQRTEHVTQDQILAIGGEKNATIQGNYTVTAPNTTFWTHGFIPPRPKTHPDDCAPPESFKDCLIATQGNPNAFKECKNHGCFKECLNPDGFKNCREHGCLYDLNRIFEWLGTLDGTMQNVGARLAALELK